jgi:hypothetical protein
MFPGAGFTIFIIFFLVHNMACFFYLVGTGDESLNDEEQTIISGWVAQEVREANPFVRAILC